MMSDSSHKCEMEFAYGSGGLLLWCLVIVRFFGEMGILIDDLYLRVL